MPALESESEHSCDMRSDPPKTVSAPWSLGEALGIGAAFIVAMAAVGYLARTRSVAYYLGETTGLFVLLPVLDGILCGVVFWRVRAHDCGVVALGLHRHEIARCLWRGLATGLLCMPALWALLVVNSLIAGLFGAKMDSHPLIRMLQECGSVAFSVWLILYAVLVRPVVEEVYFRGFLYPALRNTMPQGMAILLNAVLFAAPHSQVAALLPLAALGAVLAWTYERTGSLAAPVAMHVLNNGLAIVIFFLTR